MNLCNHGNRVIILFAKEYESVYTAQPQKTKKFMSLIPKSSYVTSHCICTLVLHVCMCACDCSDSLIMALQGLKHWSINNDYWELPKDTAFLLVNLYILKKIVTLDCAWQKGRTVPLTTQTEVLQTALTLNIPRGVL